MERSSQKASKRSILRSKFRLAAATSSGRVHVIHGSDGWSVKKEGAKKATVVTSTKSTAISKAQLIPHTSSIFIHEKDGSFVRK